MNKGGGERRNYCPLKFNGLFPTSVLIINNCIWRTNAIWAKMQTAHTPTAKEYIIWRYSTKLRARRILGTKQRKNERGNHYINSIWSTVHRLTRVEPNEAHFYRVAAWSSMPNEELLVYWNAPRTHKSNELIDQKKKSFPNVRYMV